MDNYTAVWIAEGLEPSESEEQEIEAWQHLVDTGLLVPAGPLRPASVGAARRRPLHRSLRRRGIADRREATGASRPPLISGQTSQASGQGRLAFLPAFSQYRALRSCSRRCACASLPRTGLDHRLGGFAVAEMSKARFTIAYDGTAIADGSMDAARDGHPVRCRQSGAALWLRRQRCIA
jgi:hypothetical protein